MTIHLPEELERFVHDQVKAGRYSSEDEVLDKALRLLRQRDQENAADNTQPGSEETAFTVLNRAGLIGCIKSASHTPTDLSTNPVHMEGFGRE